MEAYKCIETQLLKQAKDLRNRLEQKGQRDHNEKIQAIVRKQKKTNNQRHERIQHCQARFRAETNRTKRLLDLYSQKMILSGLTPFNRQAKCSPESSRYPVPQTVNPGFSTTYSSKQLQEMIASQHGTEQLSLRARCLRESAISFLFERHGSGAFQHMISLDLSCNFLSDNGAKQVSCFLRNGLEKLQRLSLSQNQVTDKGAKHLCIAAEARKQHERQVTLLLLDLTRNATTKAFLKQMHASTTYWSFLRL